MSSELSALLPLRHSLPIICPRTRRHGHRYHSGIVSESSDALALNVNIYGYAEPLPPDSRVFIHGQLSEGTRGALLDLDAFDGALGLTTPASLGDVFSVTGTVTEKARTSSGPRVLVRVSGTEEKPADWFIV